MQISDNHTNTFGQVKVALRAQEIMGNALHRKGLHGEGEFEKVFRAGLKLCEDTKYADLVVTKDGKVFVQDKLSGNKKQIDGFNSLLHNTYSAIRHIIFAEENKFHF